MKKIFYSAAAMAFAFFAVSCQQENLEPAVTGNTVTYTVQVADALATKALGDELTAVDKVYYEVYRVDDVENLDAAPVYEGSKPVSEGTASFELEFVKNQTFVVLFWAQSSTHEMYDITDLREVTLTTPGLSNNQAAQVFAGSNEVTDCVAANGGIVTLSRPVSQLNIFTTKESLSFGGKAITLSTSTVKVDGLYTTYNVAEGAAVVTPTPAEFTYGAATVPATKDTDTYAYVAMNYVGFAPNASTTVQVDFTITTSEGDVMHSVSSVPVKPNYRTNIVGNLLTEAADYDVTLGAWATEEYNEVVVSTAVDLQTEVNNILDGKTGEITLGGDIDFTGLIGTLTKASAAPASLIIPAEKSVVLNLNGYTLSQTVDYAGHSMIVNNGALTLKGEGTVRYTYNGTPDSSYGKGNQAISNFGTLVLDGPTVENATEKMSHASFAIDTREGATFNVVDGAVLCANATAVRMGQFGADSNVMTVEGGRIYGNRAVQVHLPSSSATVNPVMTLNVQGGVLESNDETYNIGVYVISNGQSAENVTVQIGGEAEIKGSVLVNAVATDTMNDAAIQITGGTIDGTYGVYSYSNDAAKADAVISVTGGTFAVTPNYVDPAYEAKEQDGKYVVVAKPVVAKIGEAEYWSLNAAVAAVQDGETITLVADEVFSNSNYSDNGGWKDGLGCYGDKSYTIDLNDFTISQNGDLNDYLIFVKNNGEKENVITLKNGTLDAGTTAYCALCSSSSHNKKVTINLENITLYNNISNGSTVKIRGGAVLNIKEGTKIIGKDSYLGVECIASTTNIYDGAEIYMNGTTSYNGCLAGVGSNGVINVYGGYGVGKKGGFIAMTSGGTINVAGGEWIANTDGKVGDNSNLYVLTAQSNSQESGFAGGSYINVTGGTLRGGMDAWVLNASKPEEKAGLCISGGNFNVNPTRYLAADYKAVEADGIWTVVVDPVAKVGDAEFASLEEAAAAAKAGDTITVLRDATLSAELTLPANVTLNGNGKQINGTIYAGGNLTFEGHTKVTAFSASYYDRVITIGEGACLEITGTGRVTLGYGNTFNITGSVENAKSADKTNVQPSLIIPGGMSITGSNNATMNVTNAYVQIGSTSSKNSAANGVFTLNFTNSIAEFTNQLTFAEPTSGKTPTFNVNIVNSVLTTATKFVAAAPGCNVKVDNSNITIATYFRNSGIYEVVNGSVLTGSTIQFGENGGNDGALTVDASEVTITATSSGHALDGKGTGSITLTNGAKATVTYYKDMTVNVDAASEFTGTEAK